MGIAARLGMLKMVQALLYIWMNETMARERVVWRNRKAQHYSELRDELAFALSSAAFAGQLQIAQLLVQYDA